MSETIYPDGYRSCSTCGAYIGALCMTTSSTIVDGQPDGVPAPLDEPHKARKARAGW